MTSFEERRSDRVASDFRTPSGSVEYLWCLHGEYFVGFAFCEETRSGHAASTVHIPSGPSGLARCLCYLHGAYSVGITWCVEIRSGHAASTVHTPSDCVINLWYSRGGYSSLFTSF